MANPFYGDMKSQIRSRILHQHQHTNRIVQWGSLARLQKILLCSGTLISIIIINLVKSYSHASCLMTIIMMTMSHYTDHH